MGNLVFHAHSLDQHNKLTVDYIMRYLGQIRYLPMTHIDCLGETFFVCWITLPADLKNWDFIRKERSILPDTTVKSFVSGVIRNHQENNYFETSLSFGKLGKN